MKKLMTKEQFDAEVWRLADENPKIMESIYDVRTITLRDMNWKNNQEEFKDALAWINTLINYDRRNV